METVNEFLDELARSGVKLSAQAGQLSCYAQKGALTSELREGIVRFKPELIAFLEHVERSRPTEFPLSAGQKGLYILQKLHPGMSAYNVPLCFRINADIDARVLAKAWDLVLERFPILTARIIERDGALVQRPDERCRTTMQQRTVDFADDEQLLSFLQHQVKQSFDLNRGPLTRISLFRQPGQKPILLFTVHHIVFDGASAVIVLKSLLDFYQQLCAGEPVRPSPQKSGYAAFVTWEENMLASPEGAAHARYWQKQLDGDLPPVELPADFSRPEFASFEGKTLVEDLPEDLCRWVRKFSKAHSMPPSVIFLALFQLLLHRHTNREDVVVGMPVMGRAAQPFAMEVGYFINMVPLRARCGAQVKLTDFLRKVQATMLDALYHSSYPFPLMVESVTSGRRDKSPIFKISYAYQNFVKPADFISLVQQQMFQLENVPGVWQEGDFDLGLEIYEGEGSAFSIHIKYSPDLYASDTIRGFFERYRVLLRAASENQSAFVHELPVLTERETRELLVALDGMRVDIQQKCAHDLFADQVALHPEKIAVVCGDARLTYRQLHERSEDVAVHLQSMDVIPDQVVGLCMEPSLDRIVAMLGILRAGGAYLLLDPADPAERLASIVRDSGAAIVLADETLQERLPRDVRVLTPARIAERVGTLRRQGGPDHLAYVGYVSSASGPKRVEITHRSIVNLVCSLQRATGITEHDTVVSTDVLLPLCAGARLVVASEDGPPLLMTLRASGATMLQATPSTWRVLLDAGWNGDPKLTMLCAGEPLSRDLANRLLATGGALWHLYGDAETATCSAIARVEAGEGPVVLGAPIDNTQLSILDRHGLPQIPGVPGELHIAGEGVARGVRMHNTGDLARWRDGKIELLGRSDTQVHLRGVRIELREIEAQLGQYPAIEECAVLALGQRLIACHRADAPVTADELRAHLSRTLPEAMLPAAFVSLTAIPDRAALADIVLKQQLEYWQGKLAGAPAPDLVPDHSTSERFVPAAHAFALDAKLTAQLRRLAERRGGTLFVTLLAAFKVLLHRYTGQRDLCIGTDTTPLRSHVDPDDTFAALLTQINTTWLEAQEHQDVSLDVRFRVVVTRQNRPDRNCDLTAVFTETADGLAGSLEYDASLYEPRTIERMAGHFAALCHAVAAKPIAKIRSLSYISDAERQRVLVELNDTRVEYPSETCVHQLFAEQVALHPDATAVVCGEQKLTYGELHDRSTALALYLQSMGVTPESVVALCAERSLERIIAIMGTLQAGGALLSLDPADADDRLAYMLQDSGAAVVLAQDTLRYRLASLLAPDARLILIDQAWPLKRGALREDVSSSNACQVIYTAGAGKPRGVVVEHKAVVNRVCWMQRRHPLDRSDVVQSVSELFWPLMAGASVVLTAPDGDVESVVHGPKGVKRVFHRGQLYRPLENANDVAASDYAQSRGSFEPADNTRIYILDPHGQPQPIGVAGELYVAGDALARGYLHRPKLTQESFVANPFVPGTSMLRTGDRARWLDDGRLQYLGKKNSEPGTTAMIVASSG